MGDVLKIFTDGWDQLTKSPLWLIIALMTLAVGIVLKRVNYFQNRFIPIVVLMFSTGSYALLGDPTGIQNHFPRVMLAFYGFLLGFVVWGAHRFIFKKLEKFLPQDFFPPGSFDTEHFTNPDRKKPDDLDKPKDP